MSWNTQFGEGTDAVTNYDRTATWIASVDPDVVGLCEVPSGSVSAIKSALSQRTGRTWFHQFVPKYNGTDEGNLILTWHPLVSVDAKFLSAQRSVAQATINVGGRNISFFATHLDDAASSNRVVEAGELKSWAANFAEPRVMVGDFNGGPDTAEAASMSASYFDSWNEAMNRGTASSYPDNPVGMFTRTRR
ncbi:MAG TPA: endonuclease/exonuclease/phosphatase family protein, partial [Pyrinomonadaceae bacterium]|nr:endonuclease/exonuclease/phosphatase family protein [Pyrinomonadaceae bacterium]